MTNTSETIASEGAIPTDVEVLDQLSLVYENLPGLGRPKVHALLRAQGWSISEARLKKLIAVYNNETPTKRPAAESSSSGSAILNRDEDQSLPPPVLPKNPLQAQQDFFEGSTRIFKIYGRKWDYGISPNSDQGILFLMMQKRIIDMQGTSAMPRTPETMHSCVNSRTCLPLWRMYKTAAKIAGVSIEDVGRQFLAEYGLDAYTYAVDETQIQLARRKENFKQAKLKMMAEMAKKFPEHIERDSQGNIIYDEAKHGEDALILVRIDKKTGQEIEPVNTTREKASME